MFLKNKEKRKAKTYAFGFDIELPANLETGVEINRFHQIMKFLFVVAPPYQEISAYKNNIMIKKQNNIIEFVGCDGNILQQIKINIQDKFYFPEIKYNYIMVPFVLFKTVVQTLKPSDLKADPLYLSFFEKDENIWCVLKNKSYVFIHQITKESPPDIEDVLFNIDTNIEYKVNKKEILSILDSFIKENKQCIVNFIFENNTLKIHHLSDSDEVINTKKVKLFQNNNKKIDVFIRAVYLKNILKEVPGIFCLFYFDDELSFNDRLKNKSKYEQRFIIVSCVDKKRKTVLMPIC